jgi:hypothetical protein
MKKTYLLSLLAFFISMQSFAQTIIIEGKSNITESEIRSIISIYPEHLLNKCKTITVKHLDIGSGLCFSNQIYISGEYAKSTITQTIHHELSSIFLNKVYDIKTFNIIGYEFIKLNGNKYLYDKEIGFTIKIGPLTDDEKDYFALNTYSKTSFENDYNLICEELFTNKNYLSSLKPNSVLYQKTMIVIDFYNKLDKKFTVEFFKQLF